jgi:hypothetical protein
MHNFLCYLLPIFAMSNIEIWWPSFYLFLSCPPFTGARVLLSLTRKSKQGHEMPLATPTSCKLAQLQYCDVSNIRNLQQVPCWCLIVSAFRPGGGSTSAAATPHFPLMSLTACFHHIATKTQPQISREDVSSEVDLMERRSGTNTRWDLA